MNGPRKRRKEMQKRRISIFAALTVLLASCSIAEINYGESASPGENDNDISVTFDWSEIQGTQPEKMIVLGTRFPNTLNYGYIYPEMSHIDETFIQSLAWPYGRYYVLCMNPREDLILSDDGRLEDMTLSLPSSAGEASGEKYVTDAGELYADLVIQEINSDNGSRNILLTPKNLNQELTVKFSTHVSEEVTVERITAILSGVVGEVYPFSGLVNYKDLCSIVLAIEKVGEDTGIQHYLAKANVLGLFPPKDSGATSGPGILQLEISASSHLGSRTFYAGVNLSEEIEESAPMVIDREFNGYSISGPACTLEIPSTLVITTEVLDNGLKDGVDEWFNIEKIDIFL